LLCCAGLPAIRTAIGGIALSAAVVGVGGLVLAAAIAGAVLLVRVRCHRSWETGRRDSRP
jgi:hypothetical protein